MTPKAHTVKKKKIIIDKLNFTETKKIIVCERTPSRKLKYNLYNERKCKSRLINVLDP